MSKLDAALALAAKGFLVFPIKPMAKSPPLIKGWPGKATDDLTQISKWWGKWPDANIGIHCAGMVVIDVDIKKGGNDALALLDMVEGLPATLTTRTPTGGRHLFTALPVGHPGAANSVGSLGAGLDIRTDNGYVLAPGSTTAAGVYAFEDRSALVAPAPDWLVQRLGSVVKREAPTDLNVPDADENCVGRAYDWLKTAERSVKGAGGDQAAYRVACALRDFGLSYAQVCELMRSEAWDHGCGWRAGWLEDKPIASAYRYATGEPGAKVVQPDAFPPVLNSGTTVLKTSRLQTLAEFANSERAAAGYVVKGLLQRASYAEIFGAPGEGKTFVALDIAYHVAAGNPWMGRKVHGGPVLYLAHEGVGGLVERAQALLQHYGDTDVPLYPISAAMSLRDKPGRQELGALIARLPAPPVLILIDTLARALMGGDENSAQDVGAFNSAVAALIESTGACVCIVHHTGKDASKGARGSSALIGAIDTEIQIAGGQVISRKQRDLELAPPIGFALKPLVVGIDSDGDTLTSCVVESATIVPAAGRISGNAQRGFDVLCQLSPDNSPVNALDWMANCREFLGTKSVSQRFYDLKKTLLAKGYIVVGEQGLITRRME